MAREIFHAVAENIARVMRGQDYPGTGKTTLAKALARSTKPTLLTRL